MNRGLYTSATSLLINQRRLDTISNNLANINTTGFKKDVLISEAFPEVLLSKINDIIDMDNHERFKGVNVEKDGNTYKLNINSGYFRIKTPLGISHTREIRFTIDEDGYLKTYYKDGRGTLKTNGENYVLGKNGAIRVDSKDIEIDNNGNIISNGKIVDNLIEFPQLDVIGTISSGVRTSRIFTNFNQGNIIETGNNLDFALKGDGFFKVYDGEKILYTRDGSFSLNDKGELVTKEGYFVLGKYGSIVLEGNNFTINENGDIIKDGEVVDKLDIVDIKNREFLRKKGYNLYTMADNIEPEEISFSGQVLRGYLEGSNVESIKEMVNMISVLRNYEASQKILKIQDELLGRVVNDVARI
ncbi:flagellar basal-body rod protein FlgG [Caloranaerobacter azorensis DSM 13643]|uniref:Flagellar basal-body rod protein FlgG n=1 Tax=Caloranaerobacter azorensis DSM 13643 TaxID=1121264 RepID=A0A1M5VTM6_9FIRM|nr:flagellar hook-basal body protein [Caloranaerobacter azorensis]SHH78581.1 flagellar basal-body rod protein FlgG [Caloranaerobacter azorensis DSM 13643]